MLTLISKKISIDTPFRKVELRLKALRGEQNSLAREMTLKHRDNESEGNSTVGIIRGAMDKIEGTREKNKNEFIFDNC